MFSITMTSAEISIFEQVKPKLLFFWQKIFDGKIAKLQKGENKHYFMSASLNEQIEFGFYKITHCKNTKIVFYKVK